jgi:hypothetical protein
LKFIFIEFLICLVKQLAQKPPPTPLFEIRVPQPPQNVPESRQDPEIGPLEAQIQTLKNQIAESEKNLSAHHAAMLETKNVGTLSNSDK